MKKKLRKYSSIFLMVLFCMVLWSAVPTYASMDDEAQDYTLGETYRGCHYYEKYYKFVLTEQSHVTLNATSSKYTVDFSLYNTSGKILLAPDNIAFNHNVTTDLYKGTVSRTLPQGTYYLEIAGHGYEYYFNIEAERLIKLSGGVFSSLKSNKAGQMTVSCRPVENAIGYRIQYSTDYRFRKGVKTFYAPTSVQTISGLHKGKRYYVRLRPYTVYSDGEYAFGATSYVKSVLIKK